MSEQDKEELHDKVMKKIHECRRNRTDNGYPDVLVVDMTTLQRLKNMSAYTHRYERIDVNEIDHDTYAGVKVAVLTSYQYSNFKETIEAY